MASSQHGRRLIILLALLLNAASVFAATSSSPWSETPQPAYFRHQRRALALANANATASGTSASQNVSNTELQRAQALVDAAVAQQGEYNAYRVAHPRRNTYVKGPLGTGRLKRRSGQSEPAPPVLTDELRRASKLVAQHTATKQRANGTLHRSYDEFTRLPRPVNMPDAAADDAHEKRSGARAPLHERAASSFWVSDMSGSGLPPMGFDPSYPVFRDVTNPMFAGGAKGDGVTDDTEAINAAIAYGGNCGEHCLSSSVKGTLIYFPPGTYLISSPINAYYYSQLVGDANDYPIIKTSASFIGLGAIQSDVYYPNGDGGEWYIVQSNFFRQVRNFVIDIRDTETAKTAALHWQIGQATSLSNISIAARTNADNTQMGIFTENGSGGFMSDITIVGGAYGLYGGNQQYTVRNFQILDQIEACIGLIWDWGWTWSGLWLANAPVGISMINPEENQDASALTGSTYIMDSTFFDVKVGIKAAFNQSVLDSSIITLDNVQFPGVSSPVSYANGNVLEGLSSGVDFAVIGNVEGGGRQFGEFTVPVGTRPSGLTTDSRRTQYEYFARTRPQYEGLTKADIINVKDLGAKGDGHTDDTGAIVAALARATTSNLIYFPSGSYIITRTVVIPPRTRMTGEVWSQLVASGSYFANVDAPKVMLQVGNVGDKGVVEISDMLITSVGALPGLIMMEWNVQAESQGSVGMWDAHFRVGGAYGTKLQVAECPASTPSIQPGCVAANMMLHVTAQANGYFENVWAWVADHDIDDVKNAQITVATARGILFESAGPSWLYGTGSEHAMLYQYNFANASDVFAGMIQTESAYFQAAQDTQSPGPFASTIGQFPGDPEFPDDSCIGTPLKCNVGWSTMVQNTTNVTIAGAGLYSWFDNYDQACVDTQDCQQQLVYDNGRNSRFLLWNLVTIGAVEMVSSPKSSVLAKPNTQATAHPFWSALGGYLASSQPRQINCVDEDTNPECLATTTCELRKRYATMAELGAAADSFPSQCMNHYALDTLRTSLASTLDSYTDANNGYDEVFGSYQKAMKEMVPGMIQEFMKGSTNKEPQGGPGNKFFECTYDTGFGSSKTVQCPPPWQDLQGTDTFTIRYKLVDSQGFYDTLKSTYGINSTWIKFGDRRSSRSGTGCTARMAAMDACVFYSYRWVGEPQAADNFDVPNPKDTIANSLPAIYELQDTMLARQIDLNLGVWPGSSSNLIQTFSMPVFMVSQAVGSMTQAKSLGQAQAKKDKVDLIMLVLGIVFAVIPFAFEFLPAAIAASAIARGVFLVAEAGNVALTIEGIVADPASAPLAILGLLGGGRGRTADDYASIASKQRLLKDSDLASIGSDFKLKNDEFQKVVKPRCKT